MVKNINYRAKDIEILEGLQPVRKRPGMYIGNTNQEGLHHLVNEVLDNSIDEVVAGYAKNISFHYAKDNFITIKDDGRGIPVDFHPKFKNKRAFEIVLTTLHAGGKFSDNAYKTSGGLNGVGISVVNALSDKLEVKIYNKSKIYIQKYEKGKAKGKINIEKCNKSLKGTEIKVKHRGTPPDMFKENSGVIVEGKISKTGDNIIAYRLFVKHSEEYKVPGSGESRDHELLQKSIIKNESAK